MPHSVEFYIQNAAGAQGKTFWRELPNGKYRSTILTKHTIFERLKPLLKEGICTGLNISYVESAITQNQFLMILYDNSGNPCAFILSRLEGAPVHAYLDVICAKEGGTVILTEYLRILAEQDVEYVTLSALEAVLSYYPRFGFEHRKDCTMTPPDLVMPPELMAWIKHKRPTNAELMENPMFRVFIEYLHKLGYTSNTKEECLNPDISLDEFLEHGCEKSGFEMRRCFKHTPPARTPAYRTRSHKNQKQKSKKRNELRTRYTVKSKKASQKKQI